MMKEIELHEGEMHLSRRVTVHAADEVTVAHVLCCVAVEAGGQLSIRPYIKETPFTIYHDRELHVLADGRLMEEC